MRSFSGWKHPVSPLHFEAFLNATVNADPGSDKGLDWEELFGLYVSWCLLTGRLPEPAKALRRALRQRGITPGKNTLAMTGQAARDYIVASAPSLL
ncbi:hypothetical protein PUN71_022085 [Arthrobacter sp. NQ7]|uniref:hypothetical protein n=1 Tax=Arthrobacter sp. NQ7 TaxID=3032303 RepID=UPI0024102007|nr:hypothetical protein [Arthrobacter sp. NQ7]MDJ0459901.1 hypothetical protein [Arthrobacter sp. NQ7]